MSIELRAQKVDTANKGVTGLPDTPALTAQEMQRKFDELPLAAIEQLNAVIDDLLILKQSILSAVGVVIPATTALLRGDGKGGAVAQTIDTEPEANSLNPITSGAVHSAISLLDGKPPSGAVLLWSGEKASGANATFNIAAENGETGCTGLGSLSDYKLFIFIVAGNVPYLMSKSNDSAGLTGGLLAYSTAENSLVSRGMRADVTGNSFTVTAHQTFKYTTNASINSTSALNAVYGIPVKER